jgi:ABC-type phosphate/phosphonate transport system permease subunit
LPIAFGLRRALHGLSNCFIAGVRLVHNSVLRPISGAFVFVVRLIARGVKATCGMVVIVVSSAGAAARACVREVGTVARATRNGVRSSARESVQSARSALQVVRAVRH